VIQGAEDIIVVADADNGQQALEMFRVHRPDVTLMDLHCFD
jgi:chemotaxis response regulator CheB